MSLRKKKIKHTCCVSIGKGVQIIGFISSVFGLVIVIINCYLLLINGNKIGLIGSPVSADYSNSSSEVDYPSVHSQNIIDGINYDDEYVDDYWNLPIGFCQMFSSFFLIFIKGRRYARFWITLQLLCVFYYIWNLTSVPPLEDLISKVLFAIVTFNFCTTIFMILVMIEFLVHPNNYKEVS